MPVIEASRTNACKNLPTRHNESLSEGGGRRRDSKLFVLDTNVILHDWQCIRAFADNDVAIPITVLEELDKFKKGNQELNFHARQFLRQLDEITGDVLSTQGAPLGEDLGTIRVVLGGPLDDCLKATFIQESADHRILNTALLLAGRHPERSVILVSKDTNLRMKAKAAGMPAQDYHNDKVESIEKLYRGIRTIEGIASETIDHFYEDSGEVAEAVFADDVTPVNNENFVMRNGSKSVLATFRPGRRNYCRVNKLSAYGIKPRNAEQTFALAALLNPEVQLVTLAGKAGSGKTLLTLAAALEKRSDYRQILLARPVVPLSNRDLGFLPGDIDAKLEPYMQPLFDNLSAIRHEVGRSSEATRRLNDMLEKEKLLVIPLAYIRGRSLHRNFLIVDEAQNLTPHEVKTIITRAGEGTKIVFTGDIQQIDHPYLDSLSNGLSYLINRMKGQSIYAHIMLEKGERSKLADLASDLL